MQEEYGIKLKILTTNLKNSVAQVKGIIHGFQNDIKQDTQVNFTIDKNLTLKQLESLKNDIEAKLTQLKESAAMGVKMGVVDPKEERQIKNLTAGLTMVKERIKEIGTESENTKQKMSGISINATQTNNTIVNGFKNSWKSIKRFGYALLSLRGIYGLVRKASSAYMAQDTGLAKQMQRTWASVGALLAPIIETIVKWVRIGAAYLNYFIKALTGKDLIGKAVKKINKYNKSLGGTAKAAKSVNKELTTMDEITNLSFDDGNINNFSDDIADAADGFDDFSDIKLNENITKFLDDVAEKLKQVKKFLQPIIDWAIDHPDVVLTILGGAALLSFLGKLVGPTGLLGMGSGGLLGILTALVALGTIAIVVKVIWDEERKFANDVQNQAQQASGLTKSVMEAGNQIIKFGKQENTTAEDLEKANDTLLHGNDGLQRYINSTREEYNWLNKLDGSYKEIDRAIEAKTTEEKSNTLALYSNWKQGKLTLKQNKQFKAQLQDNIEYYAKLAKSTKEGTAENKIYTERVKDLAKILYEVDNTDYNTKLDVNTKEGKKQVEDLKKYLIETGQIKESAKFDLDTQSFMNKSKNVTDILNQFKYTTYKTSVEIDAKKEKEVREKAKSLGDTLKNNINKTFKAVLNVSVGTKDAKEKLKNFLNTSFSAMSFTGIVNKFNKASLDALLKAIPAYDVGTNYVPNDQLAMVHKGEAIVPKKFNNEQYFNQSNEETNALLIEVNRNLIELRNRPNVLAVNGKEFAQATYNDFQNEGGRLNQSMTIKKVGGN